MSDGEATEAIGVVADIRRESKFRLRLVEVISSIKDANLLILMYPTREHMAELLLVEILKFRKLEDLCSKPDILLKTMF